MSAQDLTDYEYAHKRLSYDPETGIFIWKEVGPEFFSSETSMKKWLPRFAGKQAGTVSVHGYVKINIRGKIISAHRLAWLMYYGDWPDGMIDHINWEKTDNRINNLRVVTCSENARNRGKQSNNTSGVLGVTWHKGRGKWHSQIKGPDGYEYIGMFDDIEEAKIARKAAQERLGYHENHGSK